MKLQNYKIRKFLIRILFTPYDKALIYEALDDGSDKKITSTGETLHEDGVYMKKLKYDFKTEFDLYK